MEMKQDKQYNPEVVVDSKRGMKVIVAIGVTVIAISLILTGISHAEIDPETIVGMWLFDEGTGITARDSSGKGNNGKLMNGPKWVDGKFGKALEFDGVDDYVEVADDDTLDITDEITLVARVKPTESRLAEMLMKGTTGIAEAYEFYQRNLNICWRLNDNNSEIRSANLMKINDWNYIAAVYDKNLPSDNLRFFINSIQDKTTGNYATALMTNDHPFVIGSYPDGFLINNRRYPFRGLMDEVAIFNVALTEDDIRSIMTEGLKSATNLAVFPKTKLPMTWGEIKGSN